jgi:hypothetical protein
MDIARARGHVADGEKYLTAAKGMEKGEAASVLLACAQAHFAASMAITNLLLTDPAEMPEPLEL